MGKTCSMTLDSNDWRMRHLSQRGKPDTRWQDMGKSLMKVLTTWSMFNSKTKRRNIQRNALFVVNRCNLKTTRKIATNSQDNTSLCTTWWYTISFQCWMDVVTYTRNLSWQRTSIFLRGQNRIFTCLKGELNTIWMWASKTIRKSQDKEVQRLTQKGRSDNHLEGLLNNKRDARVSEAVPGN